MVNHSDKFLQKHNRLLKRREEEKNKRNEIRELKKQITYKNYLEKKRKKYQDIKGSEKYEVYLFYQKKYRDERKKIKEQRLNELFSDCAKVILKGQKRFHYINRNGEMFTSTGKKIKYYINRNGYTQVSTGELVHRLVWEVFNGKIPEGMEIDHINCIRDDNRLENLRLVTHKENCNNPISIENYRKHNKQVDRSYLRKKS